MYANIHAHARDFNQRKKETIAHALEVCKDVGIDLFCDMPNNDPPTMTEKEVLEKFRLADEANVPGVRFTAYVGLTSNPEQIKGAVKIYRKYFPRIIGAKLYAGHSVGDLGVVGFERQFIVYDTLVQEGYNGFLSVHAEKEESLKPGIWNPNLPVTHCLARPAQAEIDSVRDQILLAFLTNFKGRLHLAHLSVPGSVDLVRQAQARGLDVSWEVCAHHLILDWSVMQGKGGIWYKVNPPIRDPDTPNKMIDYLREDPNGILTDDHAPHTEKDKTTDKFMSGIVGLPYWPLFEEFLRRHNFSDKKIHEVMFENAVKRLGVDVTRGITHQKDRRKDYPFNFYKGLEERLGFK